MEGDLRALLLSHAPLTALVGTRIYWDEIPTTATRPCIVMYMISDGTEYHMAGPDGLATTRVQIDCQSLLSTEKWAIARAVEDLLSGYRGQVGSTIFQGSFKVLGRDKNERPATPANTFRVRQLDFELWWRPAA